VAAPAQGSHAVGRTDTVIVYKRLEEGRFHFPAAADGQGGVRLRAAELAMLLDGVDWQNAKRSKRYHRPATATA
jgi:transposase